ncbi:MAG: Gfo/Idh/MocA family oxidoreductase [Planctomycetota bacterium]
MGDTSSRRQFLKTTASVGAAMALSAASYARAAGANERIRIGVIGCGGRGFGAHMPPVQLHAKEQNLEITAVCDPWSIRRDRAAAQVKEWFGREPAKLVSYRDMMPMKEVDAVMIASCDHQHTTHLEAAAQAGKHAYVEKPLAMDFEKLKRACDAVKAAKTVVQIGTQLRSLPSMTGCRELYKTGILGTVSRIEQRRNSAQPYWYSRVAEAKEQDVDWKEFLMDRPMRPFDPVQFTGWYGFREFSDGPVPGFGSHFIDLVHYITGAAFPKNAVCLGGTYVWKDKYNFTCPDHVQALWEYPEGFLVSYMTNFGNSGDCAFKFLGDQGTLDVLHWNLPVLTAEGGFKNRGVIRGKKDVEPVERPDHYLDWFQCMRSGQTPNASIDAGYQHAVAVIMAMKAFDTGKRQIYDREKREIREG